MSDDQEKNKADDLADIDFSPIDAEDDKNKNSSRASGLEGELEEMEATQKDIKDTSSSKSAADLEAVFDVPVRVSVVLGRAKIPISSLLEMDIGTVVELDRQVGEAIDIHVNGRLVARGEIVLVEDRLGVTMTEIIKAS